MLEGSIGDTRFLNCNVMPHLLVDGVEKMLHLRGNKKSVWWIGSIPFEKYHVGLYFVRKYFANGLNSRNFLSTKFRKIFVANYSIHMKWLPQACTSSLKKYCVDNRSLEDKVLPDPEGQRFSSSIVSAITMKCRQQYSWFVADQFAIFPPQIQVLR